VDDAVAGIAEALRDYVPPTGALVNGAAGVALFYGHLVHSCPDRFEGYRQRVDDLLDGAAGWVGERVGPGLFHGYTGVAWVGDHLRRLFGEEDLELNEDIDGALIDELARWDGPFDLVSGLVGIGVYALERIEAPSAQTVLAMVIDRLAEHWEERRLYTWPDELPAYWAERYPSGHHDLGLAHGLPGVIAFLARCREPRAEALLHELVDWLLGRRRVDLESEFPPRDGPGLIESARTAWCYGDAGIALALARAAAVGDPAWGRPAIDIARRAARRPLVKTGVADGMLCHGAAGLIRVYARLAELTGDAELAATAELWMARTLTMRRADPVLAASAGFFVDTGGEPQPAFDFLHGIAGIGLALLPGDREWDRVLLLGD
jgi:class I lanthipeptide synthase